MKTKIQWICALLLGCFTSLFAQQYQEVIYMKNGSVVKGFIEKQIPCVSITVQTEEGTRQFASEEILRIEKELVGSSESTVRSRKREMKSTGYRGFVEASSIFSVGKDKYNSIINVSTSHGYQFNPYWFTGGGLALHGCGMLPLFAEARGNMLACRYTPLVDLKTGVAFDVDRFRSKYNISHQSNRAFYFLNPSIGFSFSLSRAYAMNVRIDYTLVCNRYYTGNGIGVGVGVEF